MIRHHATLWNTFAERWCRVRRAHNLSLNHHVLTVAMRNQYGPDWQLAHDFSRRYVASYLLKEERRTHKSMRIEGYKATEPF